MIEDKFIASPYDKISATPSENIVNYYLRLASILAAGIDLELIALESEHIHL